MRSECVVAAAVVGASRKKVVETMDITFLHILTSLLLLGSLSESELSSRVMAPCMLECVRVNLNFAFKNIAVLEARNEMKTYRNRVCSLLCIFWVFFSDESSRWLFAMRALFSSYFISALLHPESTRRKPFNRLVDSIQLCRIFIA